MWRWCAHMPTCCRAGLRKRSRHDLATDAASCRACTRTSKGDWQTCAHVVEEYSATFAQAGMAGCEPVMLRDIFLVLFTCFTHVKL